MRPVVIFVLVAAGLHALISIPWLQVHGIEPYTRAVAAASRGLLGLFDGSIEGTGNVIRGGGYAIQVLNVCNGTDLFVLYTAAVLAFPAPPVCRLVGLLVGLPALALLNLLRVVGLFLIGRHAPGAFELSHLFLWQAVLILVTAGVFVVYLRWSHEPVRR